MKVRVMGRHIACGDQCEEKTCPIAVAINENLLPGMFSVVNGYEVAIFTETADGFMADCPVDDCEECSEGNEFVVGRFALPPEARDFIRGFDDGKRMTPFSFEL